MKKALFISLILFVLMLLPQEVWACPNCKSATDSGEWSNRGLNTGILYLMSVPYIAISLVAYFWWRHSKKNKEEQQRLASILKDKLN
jgi:heme/copper-type cytochrome/quinol oxidase subunit 2